MVKQILALVVILLSASIILERDRFWLAMAPRSYWKSQVAQLEKDERRNRWHVHELEWRKMQAKIEVTIAMSAAEEKAQCLGMDRNACIEKARSEATFRLHQVEHELTNAQSALDDTRTLLATAKLSLLSLQQGLQHVPVSETPAENL
ncbi:MAG: hypothetical protein KGJ02_05525 [Verrucomicrobiota bacterium]|nr:hypothetical protein [Verrucomicrobiota bacterium]